MTKVRANSRVGRAITELLACGVWNHEHAYLDDYRLKDEHRIGIKIEFFMDDLLEHDIVELETYFDLIGVRIEKGYYAIPRLPEARGEWSKLTDWEVDFDNCRQGEWQDGFGGPLYIWRDGYRVRNPEVQM